MVDGELSRGRTAGFGLLRGLNATYYIILCGKVVE
jgi:hypothetical protein